MTFETPPKCSQSAADIAAFVASTSRIKPLPLPPGVCISSLPALLKPVRRRSKKLNGDGIEHEDDGGAMENSEASFMEHANDSLEAPCPMTPPKPLGLSSAIVEEEKGFLWQATSDEEMVHAICGCLSNFDVLASECGPLFAMCTDEDVDDDSTKRVIFPHQLKRITQALIDQLGSREPHVLERILMIYTAVAANTSKEGLDIVGFRGYVASVLTQILKEIESRGNDSAAKDLLDADGEEALVESGFFEVMSSFLQQFSASFALAIATPWKFEASDGSTSRPTSPDAAVAVEAEPQSTEHGGRGQ